MKKIFLLIIMLFCLSGCTAEVNLNFDKYLNVNNATFDFSKSTNINSNNLSYYINDKLIETEETSEVLGLFKYQIKNKTIRYFDMQDSNYLTNVQIFETCYENINIDKNNDTYMISTVGNNLCFDKYPELENIVLKINSNYQVLDTTSKKHFLNTYEWNINRINSNEIISIKYSIKNKSIYNERTLLYIIIASLTIIIIFSVIFMKNRINRANTI